MAGKAPRFPTPNAKAVYRWEINSAAKVRAFIDQITPHLRTDRCKTKFALVSEFVDKILEPHAGKVKQRFPEYIDAIRILNHRGRGAFLGQLLLSDGRTVLQAVMERKMLEGPDA